MRRAGDGENGKRLATLHFMTGKTPALLERAHTFAAAPGVFRVRAPALKPDSLCLAKVCPRLLWPSSWDVGIMFELH